MMICKESVPLLKVCSHMDEKKRTETGMQNISLTDKVEHKAGFDLVDELQLVF